MQYVMLNTGAKMPMVGFGTWQLRGEEGKNTILTALEVGCRLLDTAQMYENERIVGQAIGESGLPRREIFVTTKLHEPNASYEKAKAGIARSLETLKLDYVDLLLIHEPYDAALEMYEACKEALENGTARAIGISNFSAQEYEEFLKNCRIVPAVNQVESHVYHPRRELKEILNAHGTVMQGWAPFTQGRRSIFEDPVLNAVAHRHGKTAAQIALKYLVQCGIPVIPKSSSRERMMENLHIFDFTLDDRDLMEIAALDQKASLFGW